MATRPGYIWSGTEWVSIGQEATVNPFAYQASAPITPATGDIWVDSDDTVPSIDSAQFLRWRKTVAGGETSLSGNDDTSLPLQYTAGYEQLYINGVLQVRTLDYTATTGTTITGLTALALNDVVEIFSVVARLVGDVYTQAQADAKYATQATVNALPSAGLTLIKTQTIGTAVSSVTVSDAFSATYDAYKIVVTGGVCSSADALTLKLGATTTNYKWSLIYTGYSGTGAGSITSGGTSSFVYVLSGDTNRIIGNIELNNPFNTKNTGINSAWVSPSDTGSFSGYLNNSLSYTAFTLAPISATMTGGTIRVYGYQN